MLCCVAYSRWFCTIVMQLYLYLGKKIGEADCRVSEVRLESSKVAMGMGSRDKDPRLTMTEFWGTYWQGHRNSSISGFCWHYCSFWFVWASFSDTLSAVSWMWSNIRGYWISSRLPCEKLHYSAVLYVNSEEQANHYWALMLESILLHLTLFEIQLITN